MSRIRTASHMANELPSEAVDIFVGRGTRLPVRTAAFSIWLVTPECRMFDTSKDHVGRTTARALRNARELGYGRDVRLCPRCGTYNHRGALGEQDPSQRHSHPGAWCRA